MMQTLQSLTRKIKSAEDLHSVVRTMKSLAAVSIRQYEEAVLALADYSRSVELGLRAALRQRPPDIASKSPGEAVVFVFGSEQGMAGQFNEAIFDFAEQEIRTGNFPDARVYWIAGTKASGTATERYGRYERLFALPSSARAIADTVQQVLLLFEQRTTRRGRAKLVLFHNVPTSGAAYRQSMVQMLPPDETWLTTLSSEPWPGRSLPLFTLPWDRLFSSLIREYLFVSLFRAFANSLAAENAARLSSMQRAEKNIEEMREELTSRYHSLRQSGITEELFDIVSGFEALREADDRR